MDLSALLLTIGQQLNEAIADPQNLLNADTQYTAAQKVYDDADRAWEMAAELHERECARARLEARKHRKREEVNDVVTLLKEEEGHSMQVSYDQMRRARELKDAAGLHRLACRQRAWKESNSYGR